MSGLYQWHTAFVAVFLGFVVVFVLTQLRGPGARGRGPGR
jgi:hypothetical protein